MLVVLFLAAALSMSLVDRAPPWIAVIEVAIYVPVFLYVAFWPCPICHKPFALRIGWIMICWPWVNHCLHCNSGLLSPKRKAPR
ncbi:hypothetical protein [Dokdonella ginsengisoli]